MEVKSVTLSNFRNFEYLDLALDKGVNIIFGDNAQGKTNFLEAVFLCSTARSQRTAYDKDLIKLGENESHVRCFVKNNEFVDKVDVHLKRESHKGIAVNGMPIKKLSSLYGILLTVMFSPDDLQIVKLGPSERRRFMDMELCQLSNIYYFELQQYHKILKQRNKLLKNLKNDVKPEEILFVWDEQLVDHGTKIQKAREKFVAEIGSYANEIHKSITKGKEQLSLLYAPSVGLENFKEKLEHNIRRDIMLGNTTIGVHKDDIIIKVNDKDVKIFGSQGQQRTASLSLKLAEIYLIKQQKNHMPVLLLDDVFSELDKVRQEYLLHTIKDLQTIVTCTGIEDILGKIDNVTKIFKVENATFKDISIK